MRPTIEVIKKSIELLFQLEILPYKISDSAEGGSCFSFKNGNRKLYFEMYNDGTMGFITNYGVNKDITDFQELFDELKSL